MKYIAIKSVITDKISGEWGDEPCDENSVAIIRTTNFTNIGHVDFSKIVRRAIEPRKIIAKKLKTGDVIIEKSGGSPTQPVGRVVFFKKPDDDTYLCNNFTAVLRPNPAFVFPKYLFFALHRNHKQGKTLQFQNKTTGIINLKLDQYLDSEIPLPPLQDQIRIAHLLEKVEGLIAKRKEDLAQLDVFLKSVFLEMFGDPVRNEKGWEKRTAIDYADCIVPGRDKPKGFSGDIPWITTNDLKHLGTTICSRSNLGLTIAEISDSKARIIPAQSVILTCVGDLGVVSICGKDAVINQQLHAFIVKPCSNNAFYMFALAFQKDFMYRNASQTTLPYMNKTICNSIPMILPPLALQNQFAAIVVKVEGLKSQYQQCLADLEALYASLSQKAFAGELDLEKVKV